MTTYRTKSYNEIPHDDLGNRVPNFRTDILKTAGQRVTVETIQGGNRMVRHPLFIGIEGKGAWHIPMSTFNLYFTEYKAPEVKLDEELFTL